MSLDETRARIRDLWGDGFSGPSGILHVTAIGRDPSGASRVLRIGPDTPRSETDAFALAFARARSDAIVTTGSILRAEPEVSHDPGADLLRWRREVRGKEHAATLVVLSRGRDLPLDHPAFAQEGVLIATSRDAASGVRCRLGSRAVGVMALEDSSPRGLMAALARRGFHDVLVEAGPSTANSLYEAPIAVDELLLSVYEGAPIPEALCAGPFAGDARLVELLGDPVSEVVRDEASGPWRFRRYVA